MSAAIIPKLLTVEEFDQLSNPPGGRYELRHGEAVFVGFPEKIQKALQRRLRDLIATLAAAHGSQGVTDTEFPYRPFPDHELWAADVAFVSQPRYDAIDRWLIGSPELVIEVKSPSNTDTELNDKSMTALAGGALECWMVNYEKRIVTVYNHRSGMQIYQGDEAVPLPMLAGSVSLQQIFEGIV